jgi:hypothetical protein
MCKSHALRYGQSARLLGDALSPTRTRVLATPRYGLGLVGASDIIQNQRGGNYSYLKYDQTLNKHKLLGRI